MALVLLLALLAVASTSSTCVAAARPTYVVSLNSAFGTPITVGSHAIAYTETADTGSGIVNFPCSATCPYFYNPLNSSTAQQPSAAACSGFEDVTQNCSWSIQYHPSGEVKSGSIIKDELSLSASSPPLSFPAVMGCTLHDTSPMPCPTAPGTKLGSFAGMDRSDSSVISQLYNANRVDNVVGFCSPIPPNTDSSTNETTYMLLGSARPKGLSAVKRTNFLSPAELAAVAAINGWADNVTARMSLRYVAVISSVSFANYTFHFNISNGTANMDTGGGSMLDMPSALVTAYFQAVVAAVGASAPALNLTYSTSTGTSTARRMCVASRTKHTTDLAAITATFPNITFVFRGRDRAKAVVSAQALTGVSSVELPDGSTHIGLCSFISDEPSSIPTAFWPSQPFFRGRYSGFDRHRNALLLSQPTSCVGVTV